MLSCPSLRCRYRPDAATILEPACQNKEATINNWQWELTWRYAVSIVAPLGWNLLGWRTLDRLDERFRR